MNENFTGFNRNLAKQNIYDFVNSSAFALNAFMKTHYMLFEKLKEVWASPVAKEFSIKYDIEYDNVRRELERSIINIIINAERAYTIAANANGLPGISGIENDFSLKAWDGMNDYAYLLSESKDGVVGMNINMVVNELIPDFKKAMSQAIDLFDDIPSSIALYDDENGQSHAYSANINSLKEKASNIITYLLNEIENAAKTEANNIRLAKHEATDVLNGNA